MGKTILQKLAIVLMLLSASILSHSAEPELTPTIEQILAQPESEVDLALAALIIEKSQHPDVNIKTNLEKINEIVATIQQMPEYGPSSLERMGSVLRYFYTPSKWNNHRVYQYDLDDLTATKNPLSTISYLLDKKYGNCLSMPTVMSIIGQRIGVDIKLAIAPNHVYARYTDEQGETINIEATSGTILPDQAYIKSLDIHKDALKNEIYLQSLSNKEAIAVLLVELARDQMHKGQYLTAYDVADLALKHHPKLVSAMLVKGNVFYRQLQYELELLKSKGQRVDEEQRKRLDPISQSNLAWYEAAEKLGWREPPPDYMEKYKASIEKFKNRQR